MNIKSASTAAALLLCSVLCRAGLVEVPAAAPVGEPFATPLQVSGWRNSLDGVFSAYSVMPYQLEAAQTTVAALSVLPAGAAPLVAPVDRRIHEASAALLRDTSVEAADAKNEYQLAGDSHKLRLLKTLEGRLSAESRAQLDEALVVHDSRLTPEKKKAIDGQWRAINGEIGATLRELFQLQVDPWLAPKPAAAEETPTTGP